LLVSQLKDQDAGMLGILGIPNLQNRTYEHEWIDGNDYSSEEYLQCLRQLCTINHLTNGYRPTLDALAYFARNKHRGEPLRVLDIGFGYGDTLREIAKWALNNGRSVELVGIDLQPLSTEIAISETPSWMPIQYLTGDVFDHRPKEPYDVVLNALFMHHMDDQQTVRILQWMAANSRIGFFINDLHRHPVAYLSIRYVSKILRFNRLIQHDGPLSVARAFRAPEWREYALKAGLDLKYLEIRWHWAFRYGIRYEITSLPK
jgi:2-polyprenyl-3-methyl-5-hydroxy-6-metoxy-1,4-benzoquinol methylase